MGRKNYISVFIILACVASTSCTKDDTGGSEPQAQRQISFAPTTLSSDDAVESRGVPIDNSTLPNFGVLASHNATAWTSASTPNYIYNSKVMRVGATNVWVCDPLQYWPPSGKLSFFAYSPYYATGSSVVQLSGSATGGIPTLTYQTPEAVAEQPDLLFAAPAYDRELATGQVSMNFSHILSSITFSAKLGDALSSGISNMVVRGVSVSGLKTKATYTHGATTPWSFATTQTPQTYAVSVDGGQLDSKTLTTTAQSISKANGDIMMPIPQPIAADVIVAVRVSYTKTGVAIPQEITLEKALNATNLTALEISKKYNILLSVTLGTLTEIMVSYQVIEWQDGGNITIPPVN
ncbi:MAG: fimbrillin family protein [Rikenellaceae bacterium]